MTSIGHFRSLPLQWFYPSAVVDFMLLFAGAKPAVRVKLREHGGGVAFDSWCRGLELDYACDADGFACVSVKPHAADYILELDRSIEPHEVLLGQALGYPLCCCELIAKIGESQIDAYARQVAQWSFAGSYTRINPAGYDRGIALLSHLPCSVDCDRSLSIAERGRQFVLANSADPLLSHLAGSPLVLEEY
jgi:hypothetical protein